MSRPTPAASYYSYQIGYVTKGAFRQLRHHWIDSRRWRRRRNYHVSDIANWHSNHAAHNC